MFDAVENDVAEARELALDPTPANYQDINVKLQSLAAYLAQCIASPDSNWLAEQRTQQFLRRLPSEMARLRLLMEAPLQFYAGLAAIHAQHFGAYERSGAVRCLESKPSGKTVVHL
jgi:hypothetical protein